MKTNQRQLKNALLVLAKRLPEGFEIGLLDKSGAISGTRTGRKAKLTLGWNALSNDEAYFAFVNAGDSFTQKPYRIGVQDFWCFSIKNVDLTIGVLGNGLCYGYQLIVQATADVMSALLS